MIFFPGLHQPADARHFERCMVSVNRLRDRRSDFSVGDWIMDSGAFSEVTTHGRFRSPVEEYATQIERWSRCGNLLAAVSQDFMCEPFVLGITGLSVAEHQRLTVDRYRALRAIVPDKTNVMPVLQGFWPEEYLSCLAMYGDSIQAGKWVGVGSVCKRNADVEAVEQVLVTIHRARPDLRLHGFGIKTTALASSLVQESLYSADSMAWSYAARREHGNSNDYRDAERFRDKIDSIEPRRRHFQARLF